MTHLWMTSHGHGTASVRGLSDRTMWNDEAARHGNIEYVDSASRVNQRRALAASAPAGPMHGVRMSGIATRPR